MPETIPRSLQTTYRDLLDRYARRPSPDIEGSILRVENKGGRQQLTLSGDRKPGKHGFLPGRAAETSTAGR